MAKEEGLEVEGVVLEATKNGFLVQTNEGASILAHLAGKMRMHNIRIVAGDRVTVELSPYDLTRGRITYRTK